jgi:heme exporter protein A
MLKLDVKNLAKRFGHRPVFQDISFSLDYGSSIAVVGPNGSGKSTMLRLIAGLLMPTSGEAVFYENNKRLDFDRLRRKMAMVAPYLSLYSSLTAAENLRFFSEVDGLRIDRQKIEEILARVGLENRADDRVGEYSSGMHQRLKYAVALLKNPEILIIDEPSTNLDENGRKIVYDAINAIRKDCIVIVATNEKEEYSLAEGICQLG